MFAADIFGTGIKIPLASRNASNFFGWTPNLLSNMKCPITSKHLPPIACKINVRVNVIFSLWKILLFILSRIHVTLIFVA